MGIVIHKKFLQLYDQLEQMKQIGQHKYVMLNELDGICLQLKK
jgi:hypothetical protein